MPMHIDKAIDVVQKSKVFCPEHRVEIERVFRALNGEEEEKTFAVGDRFLQDSGGEYILAVGSTGGIQAQLVSLQDGRRWINCVTVGDLDAITAGEFAQMAGAQVNEFTRKET